MIGLRQLVSVMSSCLAVSAVVGCSPAQQPYPPLPVSLAPARSMAEVRFAYEAAIDHADLLRQIPCLCGCDTAYGHTSVRDCFVLSQPTEGMRACRYLGRSERML